MKKNRITIPGKVTSNGQLQMYMGELNEFAKLHKGKNIIASFSVYDPTKSVSMKAYYYKVVVPQFQRGMYENGNRWSEKDTELYMRNLCPVTMGEVVDIDTGEYRSDPVDINDLSNSEFVEYIDFLKQFAAEELGVFIEDATKYVKE